MAKSKSVSPKSRQKLLDLLKYITPKERTMLDMHYGITGGQPMSLRQIGEEFGVRGKTIRQVEVKAIQKFESIINRSTEE